MDNTIISALIAACVTIIGVIFTYITTKQQLRIQSKDMDLKKDQLDLERKKIVNISNDVQKEITILHQNQLQEILKKRIEVYPYLWETVTIYWEHCENNKKDKKWCSEFLNALKRCNEQYGVYFSEAVYTQYHTLFYELKGIYIDLRMLDTIIDKNHIEKINILWYGSDKYGLGLASQLKNDLGSYKIALIQDKSTK
jgi:hypothetical protein